MIKKIGIIIADIDEYKVFLNSLKDFQLNEYSFFGREGNRFTIVGKNGQVEVICAVCGIGKVNAAVCAMHLIDNKCDCILNFGLSGGISGVKREELCLCDRFLEHDFDLTVIGYKPCEKPSQKYIYNCDEYLLSVFKLILPNVKCGTAVTGDCFVCDETLRLRLKNDFDAMSCDMETAAIAYVCDSANVPFAAVRKISDDAGDDAITSYRDMNNTCYSDLGQVVVDAVKIIAENNSL